VADTRSVAALEAAGVLRVEDGNHGEYRPRPHEFVAGGTPYIRAADMTSGTVDFTGAEGINDEALLRIRKGIGREQDSLLSHKGTVGKVAYVPPGSPPFVCSPQTTFWRSLDHQKLDPVYLNIALRSRVIQAQLDVMKSSTDMAPYVSLTQQRSLMLNVPPIGEQRAIAEVLGALDDKIAANTRTSRALDALALSLAADVPQDTMLRDIATVARSMVDPASLSNDVVDLYSLPGFDAGKLPEAVTPESIKSGKFKISSPAVLVSKLNPRIPRVWEVPTCGATPALGSTEFVVLHPMGTSTAVLWALLAQPPFSASLEARVAGTSGSHQRVKPDEVLSTMTGNPAALGDGRRAEIDALRARTHAALSENVKLSATRDALLPALMSGALRVKDAERLAEDLT